MMDGPDPLDMIEVTNAHREHLARQREATIKHIGTYALAALLAGHNPRVIADKMGFFLGQEVDDDDDDDDDAIRVVLNGMMLGHWSEQRPNRREAFADWISDQVEELVKERWKD